MILAGLEANDVIMIENEDTNQLCSVVVHGCCAHDGVLHLLGLYVHYY